jgi:DNA-binding PadR family transcriptional regulator
MPTETVAREVDIQAHLPLKGAWYHILLAIAGGEQHGYAIRKKVEQLSEGKVRLWPTTLYGSIRQLTEDGIIEETDSPPVPADDDPRRRYYRLTDLGVRVLDAETSRLDSLVKTARAISHAQ